ncbi:hypothetical protein [Sediminitomix flava]|uniref:Uncharacterized protein n=1 Tax=Sediminitomix flava TaxID=379075 RepID=A0A315ZET7_SEDFL|nr:hypothetical protein [Sediminitomix flava]PWJ44041.1 hypothetical protein BC781_101391 [Sediminitomix flava]
MKIEMQSIYFRIRYGWNITRLLFILVGLLILIQGIVDRFYIGIPVGAYVFLKGLLAWGCGSASSNCDVTQRGKE